MQTSIVELNLIHPPKLSFKCIRYSAAVAEGLISEGEGESTYSQITNWFQDGEAHMLQNALNQLEDCAFILVDKLTGNRHQIAIFRVKSQCKEVASEE